MIGYYREPIDIIRDFVFTYGSNLRGVHGAGAAKEAKLRYGAVYGKYGYQGQSYGIPTKDERLRILPLTEIQKHVEVFRQFVLDHPELKFYVTPIGTGLALYQHRHIAPFFKGIPRCVFSLAWKPFLS